jgi:hypothetical protein
LGVAERFAREFLAALERGDPKWASAPAVAGLFDGEVRLVAVDKTVHAGKMAALRRLNGGMEQFVKMIGAYIDREHSRGDEDKDSGDGDGDGGGEEAASGTGGVSRRDSGASGVSRASGDEAEGPSLRVGYGAAGRRLAKCLAPPTLDVSLPDPVGRPASVVVSYGFKMGIRRFSFKDQIVVKGGLIVRIKRAM